MDESENIRKYVWSYPHNGNISSDLLDIRWNCATSLCYIKLNRKISLKKANIERIQENVLRSL